MEKTLFQWCRGTHPITSRLQASQDVRALEDLDLLGRRQAGTLPIEVDGGVHELPTRILNGEDHPGTPFEAHRHPFRVP
ncbi:hypothetical protein [Archangium violaceum]|uniref:hypothetical protein n=1 Tax=Archangium violaceum TaxID=83451 RepID=UPI0036DB4336